MAHQLVKWKMAKCRSVSGTDVPLKIPEIIDIRYRGTLLARIFAMPKKRALPFVDAIRMVSEKQMEAFDARRFGDELGQHGWYDLHFIEWMSELGYHIELTGDEFESYALSDKVA